MRVLIDTNVILDALVGRQPYFENADKIIKMCADKQIEGYLAAHSISNIFYILRKDFSNSTVAAIIPEKFLLLMGDGGQE